MPYISYEEQLDRLNEELMDVKQQYIDTMKTATGIR